MRRSFPMCVCNTDTFPVKRCRVTKCCMPHRLHRKNAPQQTSRFSDKCHAQPLCAMEIDGAQHRGQVDARWASATCHPPFNPANRCFIKNLDASTNCELGWLACGFFRLFRSHHRSPVASERKVLFGCCPPRAAPTEERTQPRGCVTAASKQF